MGWFSDKEHVMKDAKARIEESPRNSLDWLRGVETWNDTIKEIGKELWENSFLPEIGVPHNCRFDDDASDAYDVPILYSPNFDGLQELKEAEFVTEEEAVKA